MNPNTKWRRGLLWSVIVLLLAGCSPPPVKKYYMINYVPSPMRKRNKPSPYPFVIRLKEFDIEDAYARPQIVYRQSRFQLAYDWYRAWAVKPTKMITDLVHRHLLEVNLVSKVVLRYDEGTRPDYELSGYIEALEEYDSDDVWFAHVALRLTLTRLRDGKIIYRRHFDKRKKVFENDPEHVIREMSVLMDFIMSQAVHDLDVELAREYGISTSTAPDGGEQTPQRSPESDGSESR